MDRCHAPDATAEASLGAAVTVGAAAAEDNLDLGEGRVYRGGGILDGQAHGEGTLTWPSGASYTGQWVNDARPGTGTYEDREGEVYVGAYRDAEREGAGTFTWPNGRIYEGARRAGMRHGEGVVTDAHGTAWRCARRWGALVARSCRPGR